MQAPRCKRIIKVVEVKRKTTPIGWKEALQASGTARVLAI